MRRLRRCIARVELAIVLGISLAVGLTSISMANDSATPGTSSSPALAASTQDGAPAREEFLAALQRVRLGSPEPPDSELLRSYPIYDYLVAARLRRALGDAPDEAIDTAIDAFVRAHTGQPVVKTLRHAWLVSLAQRRRWDWFLPRSADVTDPQLVCLRLAARLATGDTQGLAAEVLARWSLPQREPVECAGVFAWLRTLELLTPAAAEARARAALGADNPLLAREFIAELPAERAAPLKQWLQLLETPRSAVPALAENPKTPVEPAALVAGFTRLANMDSLVAMEVLPGLLVRADLAAADRGRLKRAVALGAAYARQATAVAAFIELPAESVDGQVEEWRVRAALWAGDYAHALSWLDQMPQSLATQPRWRYWRARAAAADQGADAAAPLFKELAGMRDFYGYLAADRLNLPYNLNIHPTADDSTAQAELAAEAPMRRAHALVDCDMLDDASAEWALALATETAARKIQAARLAFKWGWYGQAIATLAQVGEWDDVALRYPRPYMSVIANAASLSQVPADWILAVMRQESLFREDAVSRADARGLMQMLPATAAAVAKRWHLPVPSRDQLFDPAVAIPLGAAHLRELLDHYGNQLELCLAAYNAGPQAVARWMPPKSIDADIWIENVPYTETRGYIQHILEHIVAFAAVRDAQPPRISGLLPPIEPLGATAGGALEPP